MAKQFIATQGYSLPSPTTALSGRLIVERRMQSRIDSRTWGTWPLPQDKSDIPGSKDEVKGWGNRNIMIAILQRGTNSSGVKAICTTGQLYPYRNSRVLSCKARLARTELFQ